MSTPSTITDPLRDLVYRELTSIVGTDFVLDTPDELIVYGCDGLTLHPRPPDFVVFPTRTRNMSFYSCSFIIVHHLQGTFICTYTYELHSMANAVCFIWFCGLRFTRKESIPRF